MTAEELLHTSIPDKRVELIRGVLVVREPAGYRHGRVSMNLPERRVARVYRQDGTATHLAESGMLEGEDVLPGFSCTLPSIL